MSTASDRHFVPLPIGTLLKFKNDFTSRYWIVGGVDGEHVSYFRSDGVRKKLSRSIIDSWIRARLITVIGHMAEHRPASP